MTTRKVYTLGQKIAGDYHLLQGTEPNKPIALQSYDSASRVLTELRAMSSEFAHFKVLSLSETTNESTNESNES